MFGRGRTKPELLQTAPKPFAVHKAVSPLQLVPSPPRSKLTPCGLALVPAETHSGLNSLNQNDFLTTVNEWLMASSRAKDAATGPLGSVRPFLDQRTFDELHNLLGNRITNWLSRLHEQLEATFPDRPPDPIDREQLGRNAHGIVSQAGTVGFLELAELCRDLEETCTSGRELAVPLTKARRAARIVRDILSGLAVPSAKGDDVPEA